MDANSGNMQNWGLESGILSQYLKFYQITSRKFIYQLNIVSKVMAII